VPNPWVDKVYAREAWPDARKISDARLDQLLDVAYEACASYAPVTPVDPPAIVPARFPEAVVLVARATWTAARASSDGLGLNDGTDLALPQPVLSSQALQLLRPPGPVVLG
jgi:hypothetical protein